MKVRGRRVAIGVVVVGAMVIVWAAIAFEGKLVEQWYLWKLESAGEEEQELAAEKLWQMKSRSAIPRLVEILRRAPKRWFAVHSWGGFSSGTRLTTDVRSHYSFRALVRIGRPAVSALQPLLEDEDDGNRLAAAVALNEIDPQEHPEEFVLRATLGADSVRR